jgi:hypothetical protein
MLHALLEGSQSFIIFHVTNVVTEKCIILIGDAKGVLELRANGKKSRSFPGEFDGKRGIAAAASQWISDQ